MHAQSDGRDRIGSGSKVALAPHNGKPHCHHDVGGLCGSSLIDAHRGGTKIARDGQRSLSEANDLYVSIRSGRRTVRPKLRVWQQSVGLSPGSDWRAPGKQAM